MWMNKMAVLFNILLGISGFYVMAFVLITGGFLDVRPTPSIMGYIVLLAYLMACILTNLLFARRSSHVMKYSVTALLIMLAAFGGTVLLNRFWVTLFSS
ncbi:hypothetical protein ACQCN2_06460 [Brevibacillus ginsengisoli]|uniref:hypothetical protein n=1 Tax=Brevibacillus ginsengisoli TaxID=363854 RepID=UPI003CF18CEA